MDKLIFTFLLALGVVSTVAYSTIEVTLPRTILAHLNYKIENISCYSFNASHNRPISFCVNGLDKLLTIEQESIELSPSGAWNNPICSMNFTMTFGGFDLAGDFSGSFGSSPKMYEASFHSFALDNVTIDFTVYYNYKTHKSILQSKVYPALEYVHNVKWYNCPVQDLFYECEDIKRSVLDSLETVFPIAIKEKIDKLFHLLSLGVHIDPSVPTTERPTEGPTNKPTEATEGPTDKPTEVFESTSELDDEDYTSW